MDIENAYYNDRVNEVLNERILSGGMLKARRKRPRVSGSKTSRPKRRSGSKSRKVKRRSGSKSRKVSKPKSRKRSGSKVRRRSGSKRRGGVLLGSGVRRRTRAPVRGRPGYGSKRAGLRRFAGTSAGAMAGGRHHKRPLTEYQKFMKQELLRGHTMADAARKWRGGARKAPAKRKRISGSKSARPKRRTARRRNY